MNKSTQTYAATKRRCAARRAAGLCEKCGKPRDCYSVRYCLACLDRQADSRRAAYARRMARRRAGQANPQEDTHDTP